MGGRFYILYVDQQWRSRKTTATTSSEDIYVFIALGLVAQEFVCVCVCCVWLY
jgi:hypothetical protein